MPSSASSRDGDARRRRQRGLLIGGYYYCRRRGSSLLIVAVISVLVVVKVFWWGASDLNATQHLSTTILPASRPKKDTSSTSVVSTPPKQHPPCRLPNQKACTACCGDDGTTATTQATTSVIWYNYGDQAGLDDRRQVLFSLANVAMALSCRQTTVRVAVPPPHQLLDAERHNTTVSPALGWSDLLRIQALPSNNSSSNSNIIWELRQPAVEFVSPVYANHKRLSTRRPQEFWRDFQELQTLVGTNTTTSGDDEKAVLFLWEFKISWHQVKQLQQPPPTGELLLPSVFVDSHLEPTLGCLSIDPWGIPDQMNEILQSVWKDIIGRVPRREATTTINVDSSLIGLLHIRRGDSQERCDTSLEKIRSYLACSLKTLPNTNKNVVFLLASDETNADYRRGITLILDELAMATRTIQLLDLDSLVWEYVRRSSSAGKKSANVLESNYYVYAIESFLKRQYADFVLEQRQTRFCHDCQDLSQVVDGGGDIAAAESSPVGG